MLGGGSLGEAIAQFEKKFKDKSGHKWEDRGEKPKANKYVFVERSYEPDSEHESEEDAEVGASCERREHSPPKSSLSAPVKSLLELIFNQQYFEVSISQSIVYS